MAYDYLMGPQKGVIIKKKRHWWKRKDELQDRIDEIDAMLIVTMPGTTQYSTLLDQRSKVENIKKTRKEIKILGGMTPKDLLKTGTGFIVTIGLWFMSTLLDYNSPKAVRIADRCDDKFTKLTRD